MQYIIICETTGEKSESPKSMELIQGEPIVARTIRFLRDMGVTDIAVSADSDTFNQFGVKVLHYDNSQYPTDSFYHTNTPVCYIFGNVVFSPDAIKTIVETPTDGIELFASAPPFSPMYFKECIVPFAYKVKDTTRFFNAIAEIKQYNSQGKFLKIPMFWKLWQAINGVTLDALSLADYTVINDYTCDASCSEDVDKFNTLLDKLWE